LNIVLFFEQPQISGKVSLKTYWKAKQAYGPTVVRILTSWLKSGTRLLIGLRRN